MDGFKSLESLHYRAARIIFNKPHDVPSVDILSELKWDSLFFIYKMRLAKLVYKIYNDLTPLSMSHVIVKSDNTYSIRNANKVMVPHFETYYMKHSIADRGSIVWNALSPHMDEKICPI